MTRLMYDSLYNLKSIPWKPGDLIMAYINGAISSGNYAEARVLFPEAQILSITTNGNPLAKANICDCETGDYTPQAAAAWVTQGSGSTIYASLNTWPAVRRLINPAIPVNWLATTLNGNTNVPGSVGVQYLDTGLYDITLVTDDNWFSLGGGIKGKDTEVVLIQSPNSGEIALSDGFQKRGVKDIGSVDAYLAAGVGLAHVSDVEFNAIPNAPTPA